MKFLHPQPFHVAENFTGVKGEYVPLAETIRGFQMILNGEMDRYPEAPRTQEERLHSQI